jgi:uncharacterized protein DUF4129
MTVRRASSVAVVAVVAAATLVVALTAWAATSGPNGVLTGDGFDPAGPPSDEPSPTVSAGSDLAVPANPQGHETHEWIRLVALVLQVAVMLLAAYLLLRYVLLPAARWAGSKARQRRRYRTEEREAEDFTVLAPSEAVAREMVADADAQRDVLLGSAVPGEGVVACWQRFETQAEAAGMARHPWETSSEYTMRVLDLVDADQPAVSRLGALYREARFSEHALTEEHRAEALAALDAIHRTIGIPA